MQRLNGCGARSLEWSRNRGWDAGNRGFSAAQHHVAQTRLVFYLPLSPAARVLSPPPNHPFTLFVLLPKVLSLPPCSAIPRALRISLFSFYIPPRNSPSFTASSGELRERNETEEKEDAAGGFRRGGRRDASEIKHLFKWQPFLSATSTHTAARYVYWHLIHVRCVCVSTHACAIARKSAGVNRAGGRFACMCTWRASACARAHGHGCYEYTRER